MIHPAKKDTWLLVAVILVILLLVGCRKDEPVEPEAKASERVMLIYMAADNNLSSDADSNLDMLSQGIPAGGQMAVYLDRWQQQPQIISLYRPRKGAPVLKTVIKTYEEHNSATTEVMQTVLEDMRSALPAQSYALVLWSHGTGWLPEGNSSTRAFGLDGTTWMQIPQLASALPDAGFDFILFDACFMASVEALYTLRGKTPYIIASSAEVLTDGFPYDKIAPLFYGAGNSTLEGICRTFYDHYNAKSGAWRTATISLVRTAGLEPLAAALHGRRPTAGGGVQSFDRYSSHYFFDLADAFGVPESLLSDCIVYKAATPWIFQGYSGFAVNKHSGLTTYVEGQHPYFDLQYKQTEWYNAMN